jgi:hypothetical protein
MPKPTTFSQSETLIIHAAVALIRSLEVDETDLHPHDATLAVSHVQDWLYEMGQSADDCQPVDDDSSIVGQVCREAGIEME